MTLRKDLLDPQGGGRYEDDYFWTGVILAILLLIRGAACGSCVRLG